MGNTPTGADADTERVTDRVAPGVREKEDGVESTPCGSCCRITLTELLNPFFGLTDIAIAEVALPSTAEAETGEADTLKSGAGGDKVSRPPHAIRRTMRQDKVIAEAPVPNQQLRLNLEFSHFTRPPWVTRS
jgi:hypothetical protein